MSATRQPKVWWPSGPNGFRPLDHLSWRPDDDGPAFEPLSANDRKRRGPFPASQRGQSPRECRNTGQATSEENGLVPARHNTRAVELPTPDTPGAKPNLRRQAAPFTWRSSWRRFFMDAASEASRTIAA